MNDFIHPSTFDNAAGEVEGMIEAPVTPSEQRLHMRAYKCWADAPRIGEFPSWQAAMKPGRGAFGKYTVILDVRSDPDDPAIVAIGDHLRHEVGSGDLTLANVSDVPRRSLLSRLTDHYLQVIANRAPIGFEAEFVDHLSRPFVYRAILLPCSSDGLTIDSIIGVMSWKKYPIESVVLELEPSAVFEPADTPASPETCEEEGSDIMPKGVKKVTYETKMQECMEIEGALGVALVDLSSGMALATAGNPRGMSLEVAAAGNTNVVRAKLAVMKDLEIKDKLEDILISLSSQYHLIRVVTSDTGTGVFIYLVLDKVRANLAMARFKLAKIESDLVV